MNAHTSGMMWKWQREERLSKQWRYDEDWLVEKFESGWTCMDLAFWDSCSAGTIEHHLEEAGVDVDSWGGCCVEFQAAKERKRQMTKRYNEGVEA